MKIRNNIKSNKDLKMNMKQKVEKMNLNWEVIGLSNSINKNYHSWLSCVTDKKDYCTESDKFGHGFAVFHGSKYFRISLVPGNSIIDQKNSKLYKTAHKDNHVWGYVVKKHSGTQRRGDILNRNYKVVGNILDGNTSNLGMPTSHYPNYTDCWAGAEIW